MKKIYLDENIPKSLADGLRALDQPNNSTGQKCAVVYLTDQFGRGIKDDEWIPLLGKEQAVMVTQDHNIHRTDSERELYQKHGLGLIVVRLPSKKGMPYWDLVQQLVRNWMAIRQVALTKRPPFIYECTAKGVKQL